MGIQLDLFYPEVFIRTEKKIAGLLYLGFTVSY